MGELISLVALLGGVAVLAAVGQRIANRSRRGGGIQSFDDMGASFGAQTGLDPHFMAMMQETERLVAQVRRGGSLPADLEFRIQRKFAAAQGRMRELEQLDRMRHEAFMDDLASQVRSLDVSIDVSALDRGP